ncbi:MAG TPA: DUF192 domain-containing protein [Candidatus Paceibacterota bacterium]
MNALLLKLASLLVILSGLLGFSQTSPIADWTPGFHWKPGVQNHTLVINGTNIVVEIAATPAARERGLADRPSLEAGRGMLFVFDRADYYSFWMKNMRFPIDIIWFHNDWRVVDITPDVSPGSFPNTYQPKSPARYVLEVNAGFIVTHGVTTGSPVILN